MAVYNVSEISSELSALLVKAEAGEEVLIGRAGKPIAKLVLVTANAEPRELGVLSGMMEISPNFDAPVPELEKQLTNGAR